MINPTQYTIPPVGVSVKEVHQGCSVSGSPAMKIETTPEGTWFYCFGCRESFFLRAKSTYSEYRQRTQQATQAEMQKRASKDWSLPADASRNLPADALVWLTKMHFGPHLINETGIQYSDKLDRVIFPLDIGWQGRCLDHKTKRAPKWVTHSPSKYQIYGHSTGRIVLVEDIPSAIRVYKAGYSVLCLMGTPHRMPVLLHETQRATLWLDYDRAGGGAASVLRRELLWSTTVDRVASKKDPKYYSNKEIREILG
jgi:hypothetical protein